MKRTNKITLIGLGLLATVFVASSCTANFCSNKEKARLISAFEPGVSSFYVAGDEAVNDLHATGTEENVQYLKETIVVGSNSFVQYVEFDTSVYEYKNSSQLNTIISSTRSSGIYTPSFEFFTRMDSDFFKKTVENFSAEQISSTSTLNEALKTEGFKKFYTNENDSDSLWGAYDNSVAALRTELGWEKCPSYDFVSGYKTAMENLIANYRACITTVEGEFGSYNGQTVHMEQTTWKEAWGKGGHLIEGLIVYPVAWLLDTLANAFAKGNPSNYAAGVPQILALIIVTVIVRLFVFLCTFKQTMSQQKMTALQPELTKIQQKYPNANTSQSEKQRLAEEQMRLYKKHGVNPLSTLIVLVIQFPVFIGVWGAMQGSAILSTGKFAGLDLSASIWDTLKALPTGTNVQAWWTALVLILLMSAGQFFSMKVPQWLQKAKAKKVSRLTRNPAEKEQQKTANIVSYVMLFMIIFMGFTLPAAMGVYWFIGAIVSLIQTLVTQAITNKKQK